MAEERQRDEALLSRTDEAVPVGAVPALRPDEGAEPAEARSRGVFARLVKGDDDIIGLVAYSIYKQHKLDWLRAFESARGRPPAETELLAYLLGEGTPRRLATYRHLADATLSGQGPHLGAAPTGFAEQGRGPSLLERTGLSAGQVAVYALIAVMFVIGMVLALRFTPSR